VYSNITRCKIEYDKAPHIGNPHPIKYTGYSLSLVLCAAVLNNQEICIYYTTGFIG